MMSIFNKPMENLSQGDLQSLRDNKVSERQNIEYKGRVYEKNDEEIREMLRDITAMANSYGGYIFLGIKQDDENNGLPVDIIGIDSPEAEKERDRILSSCLANIEPRLSGLKIQPIPISNGRSVLVIFIPRGIRSPHMIVFKGLNQFWIRHDRQKSKMAVEEIRDAFLKSEDIISEIRDFLNKRQKEILEEIGDTPFHVIGTVPIMLKDEIIDITDDNIRDFLQRPPYQEGQDWNLIFSFIKPRPTLYGLNIEERNDKYVELFRNGYYEMRAPIIKEEEESPVINPWALVGYTVNYYRALRFLGNYLGFEGSYISFLSLYT